jgi:hypothetical protein
MSEDPRPLAHHPDQSTWLPREGLATVHHISDSTHPRLSIMFNIREGNTIPRDSAVPPDTLFKHLPQCERVHEPLLVVGHELVEPILARRAGNEHSCPSTELEMLPPPMAACVWYPFWLRKTIWLVPAASTCWWVQSCDSCPPQRKRRALRICLHRCGPAAVGHPWCRGLSSRSPCMRNRCYT